MPSRTKPNRQRSGGISYQTLIATDAVPPPAPLTWENPLEEAPVGVPVSRYTSSEYHTRETNELWPRVWQMACREEEIANEGDYCLYDIGPYSLIVVRHFHLLLGRWLAA